MAKLCTAADDIIRDYADKSCGILNPFNIVDSDRISLEEELIKYSVSALCTDDKVYRRNTKKSETSAPSGEVMVKTDKNKAVEQNKIEPVIDGIDKKALALYKSVPLGEDGCAIEELVSDERTLRDVMKGLLKLEMMKLVDMLPGERVRRKF